MAFTRPAVEGSLAPTAKRIREHVLTMSHRAHAPHIACALSCVDILTALYFRAASINPENPTDPNRDRIIFSKGHACAALYATLAERGYFPVEDLCRYAKAGSTFGLHPTMDIARGIEASTGSLGHGLGLGIGIALAARLDNRPSHVYVVMSDGECNEGSVWEAALWAPAQRLTNLVAIVDFNKLQATGRSTEITALVPLADKWSAFGWDTEEVDGHNLEVLAEALGRRHPSKPRAVIAHTVKGKGVPFMENDLEWHYRPLLDVELQRALSAIRGIE